MVKFAGFLEFVKKITGIRMNVLNAVNDIFKGIKPFVEPIIGAIPSGSVINKALDVGSNIVDKVQ